MTKRTRPIRFLRTLSPRRNARIQKSHYTSFFCSMLKVFRYFSIKKAVCQGGEKIFKKSSCKMLMCGLSVSHRRETDAKSRRGFTSDSIVHLITVYTRLRARRFRVHRTLTVIRRAGTQHLFGILRLRARAHL